MQMRSVYFAMICLIFGMVTILSVPAKASKSKDIDRKEAKLKKLGVKQRKAALVIQHEKDLAKKMAKLEREKPAARKKAKEKLVKAHETFLKQTLGDKTYAAYYKSEPGRKVASVADKKRKKASGHAKKIKKGQASKKAAKAKPKKVHKKGAKKTKHEAPVPNTETQSADPVSEPGAPLSPNEMPEAAPTEAAADAQAASQMLTPGGIQ